VFVAPANATSPTAGRDLTPGDYDAPPGQQEDAAIAFSPDNRSIAYVSNHDGNDREAWSTNSDVWIVPVAGRTPAKATQNQAGDAEPTFTPDGRWLLVRAQRRPGFESDRWYLDAYDQIDGKKHTVFESPDLSVSEFTLSPDGKTIYFVAPSQGTDN